MAARAFTRLLKTLIVLALLVVVGGGATWVRYKSFDPCAWMQKEIGESFALSDLIVSARIKATFLLNGVTDPTLKQCLYTWWNYRFEDAQDNNNQESSLKTKK